MKARATRPAVDPALPAWRLAILGIARHAVGCLAVLAMLLALVMVSFDHGTAYAFGTGISVPQGEVTLADSEAAAEAVVAAGLLTSAFLLRFHPRGGRIAVVLLTLGMAVPVVVNNVTYVVAGGDTAQGLGSAATALVLGVAVAAFMGWALHPLAARPRG